MFSVEIKKEIRDILLCVHVGKTIKITISDMQDIAEVALMFTSTKLDLDNISQPGMVKQQCKFGLKKLYSAWTTFIGSFLYSLVRGVASNYLCGSWK